MGSILELHAHSRGNVTGARCNSRRMPVALLVLVAATLSSPRCRYLAGFSTREGTRPEKHDLGRESVPSRFENEAVVIAHADGEDFLFESLAANPPAVGSELRQMSDAALRIHALAFETLARRGIEPNRHLQLVLVDCARPLRGATIKVEIVSVNTSTIALPFVLNAETQAIDLEIERLARIATHELAEATLAFREDRVTFSNGLYGRDPRNRVFGDGIAEFLGHECWLRCRAEPELPAANWLIRQVLRMDPPDDGVVHLTDWKVRSSPVATRPTNEAQRYAAAFRLFFEAESRRPGSVDSFLSWLQRHPSPTFETCRAVFREIAGDDIDRMIDEQKWDDVKRCLRLAYDIEDVESAPATKPAAPIE